MFFLCHHLFWYLYHLCVRVCVYDVYVSHNPATYDWCGVRVFQGSNGGQGSDTDGSNPQGGVLFVRLQINPNNGGIRTGVMDVNLQSWDDAHGDNYWVDNRIVYSRSFVSGGSQSTVVPPGCQTNNSHCCATASDPRICCNVLGFNDISSDGWCRDTVVPAGCSRSSSNCCSNSNNQVACCSHLGFSSWDGGWCRGGVVPDGCGKDQSNCCSSSKTPVQCCRQLGFDSWDGNWCRGTAAASINSVEDSDADFEVVVDVDQQEQEKGSARYRSSNDHRSLRARSLLRKRKAAMKDEGKNWMKLSEELEKMESIVEKLEEKLEKVEEEMK